MRTYQIEIGSTPAENLIPESKDQTPEELEIQTSLRAGKLVMYAEIIDPSVAKAKTIFSSMYLPGSDSRILEVLLTNIGKEINAREKAITVRPSES